MCPADIPKTTIITPFGLFEFLRLPFGLRNAAQTFQRMMDRIFVDNLSASPTWMIFWFSLTPKRIISFTPCP